MAGLTVKCTNHLQGRHRSLGLRVYSISTHSSLSPDTETDNFFILSYFFCYGFFFLAPPRGKKIFLCEILLYLPFLMMMFSVSESYQSYCLNNDISKNMSKFLDLKGQPSDYATKWMTVSQWI